MSNIASQMSRGQTILGSMIAWELGGVSIGYTALIDAMDESGLDSSIVRTKTPRQVFLSAAKKVSAEHVIDKLSESDSDIKFQFTRRYRENGEMEYTRAAVMYMNKFTGKIFCDEDPELGEQAEKAVDDAMGVYTGANVALYLKTLFKENADIFSFPKDGGVYLVPSIYEDFLGKVDTFISKIGGNFNRLPIAKGTESGDRAFRETISGQIERTIKAHIDSVEKLTADNMNKSFESRAREINETRYKVEVYAAYLGSEAERLTKVVKDAQEQLKKKVMEYGKTACVD